MLLWCMSLYAQVEINSTPFDFGDSLTLKYTVDFVEKQTIEQKGTHLTWELPDNDSPLTKTVRIRKVFHPLFDGEVIEIHDGENIKYLKKLGNDILEAGFAFKPDNGFLHMVKYAKPVYFSNKNMMYGARFSDSTSFDLILDRSELPAVLTKTLPYYVQKIKLVAEVKRNYHFDAQGRFVSDKDKVPVLRLKVEQRLTFRIYDDRSGDEIPVSSPGIYNKIIPQAGYNVSYLFFSNEFKYYFARIYRGYGADNYIIEYQSKDTKDKSYNLDAGEKIFLLYPNPTFDISKIFISNYKPGEYTIDIYNIIGRKLKSWKVNVDKHTLLKFNLSFLRKGTYLVALRDKYGNIVATRKLIIISV